MGSKIKFEYYRLKNNFVCVCVCVRWNFTFHFIHKSPCRSDSIVLFLSLILGKFGFRIFQFKSILDFEMKDEQNSSTHV